MDLAAAVARANALSTECPASDCAGRVVGMLFGSSSDWICTECGHAVAETPERADAERRVLELLAAEDGTVDDPDAAVFRRGVTARYLHEFTATFQCWDWPTWRVVRDIVRPATAVRGISKSSPTIIPTSAERLTRSSLTHGPPSGEPW